MCTSPCRDMDVEDAIELGQRAIYHATFRDAVSGGTVSGESIALLSMRTVTYVLLLHQAAEYVLPVIASFMQ